jgi:GTP-binding protein
MVIQARFITSAATKNQMIRDGLPQIVLCGRSNVGKSTFINAMLHQKRIAKVSQTPGKTRLINYFLINEAFYFVDIPGYGYARVDKTSIDSFRERIESYLEKNEALRGAVLLLDIRRYPNEDDMLMQSYLQQSHIPTLYILTKMDKVSNNVAAVQKKAIMTALQLDASDPVLSFSAKTNENREHIWKTLAAFLPEPEKG